MPLDVPTLVQHLLADAVTRGASDLHLEPTPAGHEVRLRIDGLLTRTQSLPPQAGIAAVNRLMVLAQLLTYRQDVPQEGRVNFEYAGQSLDLRLAIMPTAKGLRAVVRLPAELTQPRSLDDLGFDAATRGVLETFMHSDAGVLMIIGPAGSGKTTTAYAVLAALAREQPGLSLIALEDPVERHLDGVTQIEVKPFGELTYARALRSILRQDPQVLLLGEIRDAETASLAVQAALSGHRLICTLHASDAGSALSRLLEMGIEPHQVAGAVKAIVNQRLVRRREGEGYRGRVPVAVAATLDTEARQLLMTRADAAAMTRAMHGVATLASAAALLIKAGITDQPEVSRVLGPPTTS